jgi:hypothetical protein
LAVRLAQLGSALFLLLGGGHVLLSLADVFRPRSLAPADEMVRQAMARTGLMLTWRTTVWRAWLGFNLSHGLGMASFGLFLLILATSNFQVLVSLWLLPIATAISIGYVILAVRFWFYLPAVVSMVGAACLAASLLLVSEWRS